MRALLLATLLTTIAAPAGPVAAQQSGVLLGVVASDSGAPYRTLWIAREGAAVRIAASGPDLIVPRHSGFWRVCIVSLRGVEDGQVREWDSLVAAPATPNRGACAPGPELPARDGEDAEQCSSSEQLQLAFVGTDAVSVERAGESDCGAHPSGGSDATLISLDDGRTLDLGAFIAPARRPALRSETLEAARREFDDVGRVDTADVDVEQDTIVVAQLRVLSQWGLDRGAGRWRVVGNAYCSPYVACGDGSRRFPVPGFTAPVPVTGPDELVPSLDAIRSSIPGVRDAVSSPRGDLVVALTDDSLLVFTPRGDRLGTPVLRIELNARIVMAQWATGRFVPRWTAQLASVLGRRR